jgi:hypothetical protein
MIRMTPCTSLARFTRRNKFFLLSKTTLSTVSYDLHPFTKFKYELLHQDYHTQLNFNQCKIIMAFDIMTTSIMAFSIMPHRTITLSITTISTAALGLITLGTMSFNKMAFNITSHNIMILSIIKLHDSQHKDKISITVKM